MISACGYLEDDGVACTLHGTASAPTAGRPNPTSAPNGPRRTEGCIRGASSGRGAGEDDRPAIEVAPSVQAPWRLAVLLGDPASRVSGTRRLGTLEDRERRAGAAVPDHVYGRRPLPLPQGVGRRAGRGSRAGSVRPCPDPPAREASGLGLRRRGQPGARRGACGGAAQAAPDAAQGRSDRAADDRAGGGRQRWSTTSRWRRSRRRSTR